MEVWRTGNCRYINTKLPKNSLNVVPGCNRAQWSNLPKNEANQLPLKQMVERSYSAAQHRIGDFLQLKPIVNFAIMRRFVRTTWIVTGLERPFGQCPLCLFCGSFTNIVEGRKNDGSHASRKA